MRRSIQETSEWKEGDREYKKLEEQLKLLHVSAAAEGNPLEAQLMQSLGFADWAYHAAIASKVLLGMLPTAPDDVGQLNKAKMLQSRPWPTTVDWDGRAEYEKDKPAVAQPVMQHYLKRMKPWMYK